LAANVSLEDIINRVQIATQKGQSEVIADAVLGAVRRHIKWHGFPEMYELMFSHLTLPVIPDQQSLISCKAFEQTKPRVAV